jgi:hypothetical protein
VDLIELYHRLGISLARSKLARSPAARRGYSRLARRYSEQIDRQRHEHAHPPEMLIPAA